MSAMSVARFGGVVLLNPPAAERIIDALLRYIGQLPPCRERTDILALTDRLRSAYADTQRKVSQNVSVQRPQGLSCHDPSRDGSQTAAAKPGGLITAAQAAELLGITAAGVRYLARTKALPAVQTPKGRWLLDADAVHLRAERATYSWNP